MVYTRTPSLGALVIDGGGAPAVLWQPSDATGATDMTSELEAFRTAHPGKMVKVEDGSTILLANAFAGATTGDILLDFSNCTVLYNHLTSADYAVFCDNTANASAEVAVTALSYVTVNTNAAVSRVTISSTLAAERFDWIALYSTDVNPANAGGQLGEIFQLITDEASLELTATRELNRHGSYATSVKARKLNAARRVWIRGGTFRANGDTEDQAITARATGILVRGFVDPLVEDVTFDRPWSTGLRFQCCAAPRAQNITTQDVGNLANVNGYTYGVYFYGMNDQGDVRNLVVRNGRHAGFTTDGNGSSTPTWYNKGIPTNALITGVHGYNCHASVVDTHEEGDRIIFDGVYDYYPYQDEDISGGFTGLGVQFRAARTTLRNYFVVGGTRGIKVNALDHGFEDKVVLENVRISSLTSTHGTDADVGIVIDDQSALTNKRHVLFFGSFSDVGLCISVGKMAKLTVGTVDAEQFDTFIDAGAGSTVILKGNVTLDYRNDSRTAPYQGVLCRSDATYGGASVVFLQTPKIIKGTSATPVSLFVESDTTASKPVFAAGIIEHNGSAVTGTTVYPAGATTFTAAPVAGGEQPLDSDLTAIAGLTATTNNIIQSVGSAWASRTPAEVRTALGLVVGTNVQAWGTALDAIAALSASNDDLIQRKSGVWVNRTLAQVKTDLAISNVDNTSDANKPVSAAAQTALDGKQTLDSDLTTIAGLTPTTDNFMVAASSAWASRTPAQAKTALSLAAADVGLSVSATVPGVATGTGSAGSGTALSAANHVHPAMAVGYEPTDYGFISMVVDPAICTSSVTALATAGTLYGARLKVAAAATVTNIEMYLSAAGSGLTSGQCFAALYQNGNLLAQSADLAGVWNSTAWKTIPLSSAQAVTAGFVDVVIWFNGTTGPAPLRGSSVGVNGKLAAASSRFFTADTGKTTTAPSTLGTKSTYGFCYFFALS